MTKGHIGDRSQRQVLHVAESFGGGVGSAILEYAKNTPEFDHHVVYGERMDSPLSSAVLQKFTSATPMGVGHLRRLVAVRRALLSRDWDVVHLHSSFGGFYGRIPGGVSRRRIVYTPHCYAFERQDIPHFARAVFMIVERILALRTGVFAACSKREARLSKAWPRPTVVYVPNVAPRRPRERAAEFDPSEPLRIFGAGRDAPQKDPEFFLSCVESLRSAGFDVEAKWIGGSDSLRERFARAGVTVTGWLPHDEVLREMAASNLYIHTAAWEGFPVAILEAVNLGVPTLARKIPAYGGLDIPQFENPAGLVALVSQLGTTEGFVELLERSSTALRDNSPEAQRAALLKVYSLAAESPRLLSDAPLKVSS